MDFLSILTAIALLAVAVVIIGYFFRVLLANLHANPRGLSERWSLKKKERILLMADEQIQAGKLDRATSLLREAFFAEHIKSDPTLIDRAHNHHMEILGRILTLSEKLGAQISNIAVVEGLFQSRADLMRAYLDISKSQEALDERRREKGQATPEWALAEFTKRLDDVKDKLKTNDRSLASQLEVLFASLASVGRSGEVTYH